jgi:hypothetical protein
MEQFRELARALALRDFAGADIILRILVSDEQNFEDERKQEEAAHQVELGYTDAANIRRRDGKVSVLKAAA